MACRFVVVAAARDGVGKSTFAVNIALSLLKKSLRDQTLSIGRVLPDTVFQKSVP